MSGTAAISARLCEPADAQDQLFFLSPLGSGRTWLNVRTRRNMVPHAFALRSGTLSEREGVTDRRPSRWQIAKTRSARFIV